MQASSSSRVGGLHESGQRIVEDWGIEPLVVGQNPNRHIQRDVIAPKAGDGDRNGGGVALVEFPEMRNSRHDGRVVVPECLEAGSKGTVEDVSSRR